MKMQETTFRIMKSGLQESGIYISKEAIEKTMDGLIGTPISISKIDNRGFWKDDQEVIGVVNNCYTKEVRDEIELYIDGYLYLEVTPVALVGTEDFKIREKGVKEIESMEFEEVLLLREDKK